MYSLKANVFYILIILSINSFSQVENMFTLNIRQLILPADINLKNSNADCLYKLSNNRFEVFTKIWIFNSISKENELAYKKKYSTKISIEDYEMIKMISRNMLSFDSSYSVALLDGNQWVIDYVIENNSKRIVLDNYSLKETNEIFSILNKYIRKRKFHLLICNPNNK